MRFQAWMGMVTAALLAGGALAPTAPTAQAATSATLLSDHVSVFAIDGHFRSGAPYDHFRLTSSPRVAAGLVRIALANRGSVPHEAIVLRLNTGVTPAAVQAADAKSGPGAVLGLTTPFAGASNIMPGATQVSYEVLPAGTYVVVCFNPGAAGHDHLSQGMLTSFRVLGNVPTNAGSRRPAGFASGIISAHTNRAGKMSFTFPARFKGHGVYRFVNNGVTDVHELQLVKLLPGKKLADLMAWWHAKPGTVPPPFTFAGGAGVLAPQHGAALVGLFLPPGNYVATCFVPDEKTGIPHGATGMDVPFTIG